MAVNRLDMDDRTEKLAEDIKRTMKNAGDWERKRTSIPGIFIVRMPDKEFRVMLMFSPIDEAGNPRKRRGLFFGVMDTVEAARKAFPDERLDALVAAVQKINGSPGPKRASDGDVFEV